MAKNFVSNKDETIRMFDNNFLESLSKIHFTVPLYIYIPVIFYFLYKSVEYSLAPLNIILLIVFGLFIWTLTEYTLHRFIFHFPAKTKFGKKIHFIFHGVHHDYPSDSKRLVMPPSVSIPLALLFYFLFKIILGEMLVAPFFMGFLIGYLIYDISHYAFHHFNLHNKFLLNLKNHHIRHHYDNENLGYGVSNKFWDKIIGTNFPKK